jgi:hypothetical protein
MLCIPKWWVRLPPLIRGMILQVLARLWVQTKPMESPGPLDKKNAGISGCSYLWELRGFHPIHENLEYSSKFHGAMFYGDLFDGNILWEYYIYIHVSTYLILYIYIHPTIWNRCVQKNCTVCFCFLKTNEDKPEIGRLPAEKCLSR